MREDIEEFLREKQRSGFTLVEILIVFSIVCAFIFLGSQWLLESGRWDDMKHAFEAMTTTSARVLQDGAQKDEQLLQAIPATDVEHVRRLLAAGAEPDRTTRTNQTAIDLAAELFAESAGKDTAIARLTILTELTKHIRHRDGKAFDALGNISVTLVEQSMPGSFTSGLQFKAEDGSSYHLSLSRDETIYRNTSLDSQTFLVDFSASYRIHGFVLQNILEAEEVELLKTEQNLQKTIRNGIVVPIPIVLRSTEIIGTPWLEKRTQKPGQQPRKR